MQMNKLKLTSCKGNAAEYAPSSTIRSIPTSPFFSLPNGVVASISYTILDLWAREKNVLGSSEPKNLQKIKTLFLLYCSLCSGNLFIFYITVDTVVPIKD